ncbi:hypothetical protein BT93_H2736 [Corymbia citriodora subsp. variegata]|nr:hypothetical protein BT93_H2736 [Corymbia citriodora subsp. variegata]
MGGVAWTEEEDHLLKRCIEQYGEGKWHRVPKLAGLNRCRKSCRLRWLNYLRPNIKRGSFTEEEVDLIIKLHNLLGNRWSLIAGRLPGRTANDVKNYWNCHLSKKLDPQQSCNHEDNDLNTKGDVEMLSPSQQRDFDASSGGWTLPPTAALEAQSLVHPPMPEEIGTSPSPPPQMSYVDQAEFNSSNPPFFEEDGHVLGDLGMDLQFDGSAGLMQSSKHWDWDELISDLDLWG